MRFLRITFILGLLTIGLHSSMAQCIEPVTDAGLFCDTNSPSDPAPIICSLDCLDGFAATMPSDLLDNQPEFLCATGGTPNNLSWFAFVAGGPIVDLTITPSNCTQDFDQNGDPVLNTIGIQAGIYSSCNFEDEDIVVCFEDCTGNNEDPVNLSSNNFIEGQIYYLFVDGCGGSVCDYTVTVNAGDQAFEMQEITTISNTFNYDLDVDTICQGAAISFQLDDFDLDVNFNWSIIPATTDYPTGVHPVNDSNIVEFQFSDEGVFDIIVYAYNECDASEPDTFQVTIAPLEDEYFTDVELCEECILEGITLVSPDPGCIIGSPLILTEDPNGDGVPGWLGLTEINTPGPASNVVTNVIGCQYTQFVMINEIPIGERTAIDTFFCFDEFPVVVDGLIYNSPDDFRNLTIENGAASGCDSLLRVTAKAIDLIGNTSIADCENGIVTINFNVISVSPAAYDSIIYEWYDENGDLVTDTDNVDSQLQVTNPGSYSVIVTVEANGKSCEHQFVSIDIDPENLSPTTPSLAYAPIDVCVNEGTALIYVNNQGLGEDYTWTLTPSLPFMEINSSDTILVDVSSGQSFNFCVMASNGCGVSTDFCDNVIVSQVPSSAFTATSEICIGDTVIVEYTGGNGLAPNSEFNWSFAGGTILNGANPQGAGPFELEFTSTGNYNIGLLLTENGCNSDLAMNSVSVVEPFAAPTIDCVSQSGSVTFGYDTNGIDNYSIIVTTGQSYQIIAGDSILIDGLSSEENVSIEILFNDGSVCGGQTETASCNSLACPNIDLEIVLDSQDKCIEEDMSNINLDINITGDNTGSGAWTSPFVTGSSFDVNAAGVGSHLVTYDYNLLDCSYSIDSTINLFSSPDMEIDIIEEYCDESIATLTITASDYNMITLNDQSITDMLNGISITEENDYTIVASNLNGCTQTEVLSITSPEVPEFQIAGPSELITGNIYTLSAIESNLPPNLTYTWILGGDTICIDCQAIDIEISENQELCLVADFADECFDEVCLELTALTQIEIYTPNIFSPNGDNINDKFAFQANNQRTQIESLTIFDRWGTRVFNSKEFLFNEEEMSWDGTMNGRDCTPGVYVYIITYRNLEGTLLTKTGDVSLIR